MNPNNLPPPGQQVIHVTQDLDTDLEALFNSVMNPKPSSWRKKILPESFFTEPDSGSHSRQSSTDSGSQPPRPAPQHGRSFSSPATMQIGTSGGGSGTGSSSGTPSPAQAHVHPRQKSYDVTDELPLPPGWEMAFTRTGERYFLNHIEKITTWQDPRKSVNQSLTSITQHQPVTSTPMQQQARSLALSQPNLGQLPEGWEQAMTPQGEIYFIDHKNKKTSWLDPRLDTSAMMTQQQQQIASNSSLTQQSHGTQQNHAAQTPATVMLTLPTTLTPQQQQQQQQKLRLQRIQMERERIRMQQEELLRQEAALCRQIPMESDTIVPVQPVVTTPSVTQDIRPVSSQNSDPFLNSGPYHSREQSTDSGLGLGCYSIPTTPEDFLGNVDEMDTGEPLAQNNICINPQSRFSDIIDSLPGTNVDLGTLESEDLIPILNDVESVLNKEEPFLTWL
ncbi:WW domain-containing transcription regulator protein 1 isoform X2 [Protopterus annectens]|uniref:WW domain-containing transcription regulator protein 1 isoform X2 n=1 Tax=Protopterus annectens TaxID=7888 RepID=UPI001CF99C46|nr:WW domain-containing transcription regulator protein 1 isoform X2 [Protopterus annectens]